MALYAIGDLHLSLNSNKPMDIFGEGWVVRPSNEAATGFRVNQVGYLTNGIKRAIVIDGGREFSVVDVTTGRVRYTGQIEAGTDKVDPLSGDIVCYADFTDFTEEGYYYLSANGISSYPFYIGENVYNHLQTALLRMFYYQRCGTPLEEEHAGIYSRDVACHTYADAYALRSSRDPNSDEVKTSTDVHIDLTGGWHEAGDCSKQIASGVCAALTLIDSYRLFPEAFGEGSNIPESGNGVPDILDEARWELEYLFKVQDKDSGGIYWTVFQWRHPPVSWMPEDDNFTYYAYATALESTGMVCQLMSLASRIYAPFDAEFAQKCFECAKKCWGYLETHKDDPWCREYLGKYGYGNAMGYTAKDPIFTRYGAACEMYLSTGEEKYLKEIRSTITKVDDITDLYMHHLAGYATMSCLIGDAPYKIPETLAAQMASKWLAEAQSAHRTYQSMAYEIPFDDFDDIWTNQALLRKAMILIFAERLDSSLDYSNAIENSINYILGQNAVNFSFISGFGTDYTRNYHTRQNKNDGIDEPLPGYMVFGPYDLEKMAQTHSTIYDYLPAGTPDMKAYVDVFDFYRINEIEIDSNSYPVFLIAYLRSKVVNPADSETALGVYVNQVGYHTNSVKRAVVTGGGRDFHIVNADTGNVVYSSQIEKGSNGVYQYSGDVVCYADFTALAKEGTYYLWIPNGNVSSYTFTISDKVYDDVAKATLKAFYYQRCGVDLDSKLVINGAAHPACHLKSIPYYYDQANTRNVTGGWHDAGDNGIYTTAVAYTVQLLLSQYLMMPDMYGDDGNIPESSNGIPDILDETRIGLDWLLQMQDTTDGGVYLQISGTHHAPSNLLPHQDTNQHYIWPKRLESTCGFVAAMALASKVYADVDPAAARVFYNAAIKSGEWIKANWEQALIVKPEGFAAGWYVAGDSLDEERLHASVAMSLLTDDKYWKEKLDECIGEVSGFAGNQHNNSTFMSLWLYLSMPEAIRDDETREFFEKRLKETASEVAEIYSDNPWQIANSGNAFGWGSNHELCSNLLILICSDRYFGENRYTEEVVASVDYILGKNPTGYSFITGFGTKQVINMHHRMRHDGNGNYFTMPGYMVSGPVKYAHALVSHKNLDSFGITASTPNMKCFYDDFSLYRFTESDLFRLVLSSWVLNFVRDMHS